MLAILLQVEPAIWSKLGEAGVLVLAMAAAIYWLVRKLDKSEIKCDQLNAYIQSMAEKNITTLKDVQVMMEKVFDNQVNGDAAIKHEILEQNIALQNNLKDYIKDLLDHTNHKNEQVNSKLAVGN
ncbi:hypothetical protein HUW51_17140 [Adhaeribacter swui]|uniref:Uncharacterized protein n=1 Tax=Adhaeribacter swui TaxID=2086471 RepID=A0A7G7GB29_9BACT|nr:hypothetical protein [Adhaeribacter swui]QNF34363.1 hypothetical protein HUW51_17140 [Adhaeribacter swui]